MDCSNNIEVKNEQNDNAQKKASYGTIALLTGSAMSICIALSVYHYKFIQKFVADGQKMELKTPKSLFTELMQKYINIWVRFFGDTPSTIVLAFLIPITVAFMSLFIYYATKYYDYYKADKAIERANKNALMFELKNEIIKEQSDTITDNRKDSNDDKPSV